MLNEFKGKKRSDAIELAAEPYSYTQFLEHYRRKYPKEKGSMKLQHIAGEEMFVDFAGKKLQMYPPYELHYPIA
ncbi:hypothetical protein GCM10009120_01850 [Sphingobacterium siyangense subsp. cladoniae]